VHDVQPTTKGLIMPAVSKSQQQFMGIVHAIQKGDMPASEAGGKAQEAAKTMKPGDVTDFASTKREGLPEKKEEKKSFTLSASDRLIMASALSESMRV
jgi:hypothetical protein